MIKSKYSYPLYFGWGIIIPFLLFALFLLFSPVKLIHEYTNIKIYPPIVGLIIIAGCVFIYWFILRDLPQVIISENWITVKWLHKRTEIYSADIKKIDLFGNSELPMTSPWGTIVTKIILADERVIIIQDFIYRNTHKLKQGLKNFFPDKILYLGSELPGIDSKACKSEQTKFAGNPLTSIEGVSLFIVIIGSIVLLCFFQNFTSFLSATLMITLFYFFSGNQLHYFMFSGDKLYIRNHVWSWVKKEYDINTIVAANFESINRESVSLRITTRDFKTKKYQAGSLRDNDWIKLKEKLKQLRVHFVEVYPVG